MKYLVYCFRRGTELYVMLAAKFTIRHPLAEGLHYVTLLRDPISRFLSEFYETYDGWEVRRLHVHLVKLLHAFSIGFDYIDASTTGQVWHTA